MKNALHSELMKAMKEKNEQLKGIVRLIMANVKNEEIKLKRELTDDEVLTLIKREHKQTKEALLGAESASREDLIAKENSKLAILESYMPSMLTEDEIKEVLLNAGAEVGMPMGRLMGMVMKDHKAEVDGALVRKVIEDEFTSKG